MEEANRKTAQIDTSETTQRITRPGDSDRPDYILWFVLLVVFALVGGVFYSSCTARAVRSDVDGLKQGQALLKADAVTNKAVNTAVMVDIRTVKSDIDSIKEIDVGLNDKLDLLKEKLDGDISALRDDLAGKAGQGSLDNTNKDLRRVERKLRRHLDEVEARRSRQTPGVIVPPARPPNPTVKPNPPVKATPPVSTVQKPRGQITVVVRPAPDASEEDSDDELE